MRTKKLFWEQPDTIEFPAKVLSATPSADNFAITIPVIDVIETENEILHILPEQISAGSITGKIDWERRFDFMQQHTAFHILAQSFLRVAGKKTLSSHLGEVTSTIDLEASQISDDEIGQVEALANRICFENRKVNQFFVNKNELDNYPLRVMPTKGERIRLVEIENFDIDPCGGTHVNFTAQVGIIKILSQEKIRGNIRLTFVAGKRALADYQRKWQILKKLSTQWTEAEDKLVDRFDKLQSEQKELLKIKKKYIDSLISREADELIAHTRQENSRLLTRLFEDREVREIRDLAKTVTNRDDLLVIFGIKNIRSNLIIACSEKSGFDLRKLAPAVRENINANGGGRPNFIEFGGIPPEKLEKSFPQIIELLSHRIKKNQ
ncbi:hypothetical protein B6D60_05040 [candidate division KSB1 bacterium 4484_87]|nr:MAG: hypothetical protein B6D60_05040 [candidate division KSB1 bacterium 4484_87]